MEIWMVADTDRPSILPDYRVGELARVSGVTARNIRAYRERGLLDPPRRAGRAAIYDDHHLAQLRAIDQLLRRGFTSAHIAEFFDAVRRGSDLIELLGLWPQAFVLALDGPEADALLQAGLVQRTADGLAWTNPAIGVIVARTDDQRGYVRFILQLIEAVDGDVRRLADRVSATVGGVTGPVADHHELGRLVATDRLDRALGERL